MALRTCKAQQVQNTPKTPTSAQSANDDEELEVQKRKINDTIKDVIKSLKFTQNKLDKELELVNPNLGGLFTLSNSVRTALEIFQQCFQFWKDKRLYL